MFSTRIFALLLATHAVGVSAALDHVVAYHSYDHEWWVYALCVAVVFLLIGGAAYILYYANVGRDHVKRVHAHESREALKERILKLRHDVEVLQQREQDIRRKLPPDAKGSEKGLPRAIGGGDGSASDVPVGVFVHSPRSKK